MSAPIDSARDIADYCLQLREELWRSPNLISGMTAAEHIKIFLAMGATPELIKRVVGLGMRKHKEKGYSEIRSLLYFQKPIQDELAKQHHKNRYNVDGLDDRWQQRIKGFREKGTWLALWGPKPGEVGCAAPRRLIEAVSGSD